MKDYFSDLLPQNKSSYNDIENNPASSNNSMPIPSSPEGTLIMGVMDITKETIRCFTDYAKCKEHEKTERKRIAATLRALEYKIDAQKELYLKELDKQYEERNRLYTMAEKAQEKALNTGDTEMLQLCYNLILNVYDKPFNTSGNMKSLTSESVYSSEFF